MKTTKKSASSPKSKSETRVEIKPTKGRPMLTWVGKKPLRHAIAYPAQHVESFNAGSKTKKTKTWEDWPKDLPQTGLLFHGDNKDVLAYLLANGLRGKVKLIYIDPPFDSGADYVRKVELREAKAIRLEGEDYTLGEQTQYTDIWTNDNYLQFMYERLMLMKELLSDNGSLWLQCDYRKDSHLRFLLDEIFGPDCYRSQIIWNSTRSKGTSVRSFGVEHQILLYYTKSGDFIWNQLFRDYDVDKIDRYYCFFEQDDGSYLRFTKSQVREFRLKNDYPSGRRFALIPLVRMLEGERKGLTYEFMGFTRTWSCKKEKMLLLQREGKIVQLNPESIPQKKQYYDEMDGIKLTSLWDDISPLNPASKEKSDYPTQKPEALLERIIELTSNFGDIVLDCFLGSGTTASAAQKLGRRWIGADINKGAIQTTIKRLQGVIQEQVEKAKNEKQKLPGMETEETAPPAQLGFAVYRVNDYDLQIQHNEAFNLAVEHLGMTRTKTDTFFDGTLGKKLVKIVPFNHPVTPLDLEEVKKELNNRPDEERDIVVVGLGKEVAVEAWLEEWNKLRKQGNIPNKIEVIELRSDPKYGGFFTHEPVKAKVSLKRTDKGVEITIDDFISPTILERLKQQNKDNPLFQPQVSNWRSMVDSVMIDSAYHGKVFNITLADVPEKKNDLVDGKYLVEAKKGATIAVKVTDMLGEELLVVGEE